MDAGRDTLNAALFGGAFLTLLLVAELWSRSGKGKPEWTRKLVHFGGGVLCLSLPWAVQSPWFVLGLAVVNSVIILVGRKAGFLRCLHSVKRHTLGSEYYPISIFLVFVMSHTEPWLYVSSILVLAVSDAFAAIIGSRYGSITYNVEDSDKSLQGSLAFMVTAFLAMLIPMILLSGLPYQICLLSALLVAMLVTGFEAISLSGSDNLFVPIGVCFILAKITTKPVGEILYQTASLVILCILITTVVARVHSFNAGGTITLLLVTYGAWSLGSERWALPLLLGFLTYVAARKFVHGSAGLGPAVKVRIVFHALVIPLLILIVGNMFGLNSFLYAPFVAAVAIVTAFSVWNHVVPRTVFASRLMRTVAALFAAAGSYIIVALPAVLLSGRSPRSVMIPAAVAIAMGAVHDRVRKDNLPEEKVWCAYHLALTALAAVIIILLQVAGYSEPWD
jgi:dolichol kinase